MKHPVPDKGKDSVRQMFDDISPGYDRMNRILSLGTDRRWRKRLMHSLRAFGPGTLLDLATGTGDVAIAAAAALPAARITGADLSEEMLKRAKAKADNAGFSDRLQFETADAENLRFETGSLDAVTVAFGVRNFEDLDRGLTEITRVLRRGGKIFILEFSLPGNVFMKAAYNLYLHAYLPVAGRLLSGHRYAYTYLRDTIHTFPSGDDFCRHLQLAGLTNCISRPLSGGIATLYTADKP